MAIKLLCVGTADAAQMLDMSERTIWRQVKNEKLQSTKLGRARFIPLYEVANKLEITLAAALAKTEQLSITTHAIWLNTSKIRLRPE